MPDDQDTSSGEGKTFTQADVDRIVADRLKRLEGKYAGFDELKAKADRLDELEAATKSDVEKLNERAAAADKRAADAEARANRMEVAAAKGLTAAQAKRLIGTTREELEADADDILAAFGSGTPGTDDTSKPPPPGGTPKPNMQGGSDPTAGPDVDIRKIVESIPR